MAIKAQMLGRDAVMKRLRQLVPDAEEGAAAAQLEAAKDLAKAIQPRAPRGATGEYAASIQGDRLANRPDKRAIGGSATKDPNATGVFASHEWRWLEFGTGPHVIKPKGAPALTFRGREGFVSVKSVNHPGTAAQPHIFPTFRAKKKAIRRKVAGAINKAVRKARGK